MTAARRIDDLGVMSDANFWKQWRVVRDPRTGREVAMGQAMHGGFVLADPATGEVTAVPQEEELPHTWASTQAPDGRIYQASVYSQAGDPPLLAWDGRSPMARVVARMKCRAVFAMDAAPDNRVYLPDYHSRLLYMAFILTHPRSNRFVTIPICPAIHGMWPWGSMGACTWFWRTMKPRC